MNEPAATPKPLGTVNSVVPQCPICGARAWIRKAPILQPGKTFQEIAVAAVIPENTQVDQIIEGELTGMAVINFVCSNCGFVRQHDRAIYKP
jgi:hypothetical protein